MPKSSLYLLLLFLHLVTVVAAFAGAALIHFGMFRMRGATRVGEAIDGAGLLRRVAPLMPLISLGQVITGVALTALAWSWHTPWIEIGIATVVAMQLIAALTIKPRAMAIGGRLGRAMAGGPATPVDAETKAMILSPVLWTGLQLQPSLALGIMCLMVMKPGPIAGIAIVAGFAALGAAVAVPCWRMAPAAAGEATLAKTA